MGIWSLVYCRRSSRADFSMGKRMGVTSLMQCESISSSSCSVFVFQLMLVTFIMRLTVSIKFLVHMAGVTL